MEQGIGKNMINNNGIVGEKLPGKAFQINTFQNHGGDGARVGALDNKMFRSQKIRQDRFVIENDKLLLRFGNNQYYCVLNFSPFGIAVQGDSNHLLPEDVFHGTLFLNDKLLFDLYLRKKRCVKLSNGLVSIGLEIVGKPINVDFLRAIIDSRRLIERSKEEVKDHLEIPSSFKIEVFSLRIQLEQLEKSVNELSSHYSGLTGIDLSDFESVVASNVARYLSDVLVPAFNKLSNIINAMSHEKKKTALDFFRSQLGSFIIKAPFANRSLLKPLGYAGDFEVMNLIYRDKPEGETLFGKCLHRHFIDQPAAKSVRNRVEYVISHLEAIRCVSFSDPIRILSVASGPAVEIQRWLATLEKEERKVEIDLFDQDVQSLKYAQKFLMGMVSEMKLNCNISFINQSVRKILAKSYRSQSYDFIYSLGLFDYLSDHMCQSLGAKLFSMVKEGGRMVVGNFNIDNPTRPIMELALDWKLIYRSRTELQTLFGPLGGRMEIECEREGVNLFCVIRR